MLVDIPKDVRQSNGSIPEELENAQGRFLEKTRVDEQRFDRVISMLKKQKNRLFRRRRSGSFRGESRIKRVC